MSGEGEGDRYSFLEISNPEWLLISGEKEGVKYQDCKELARLHSLSVVYRLLLSIHIYVYNNVTVL